jgi:hypothetical protein
LNPNRGVKKYSGQSLHYLHNAENYINKGDSAKASEFLWGGMAQALKAVAASKEISLRGHRQLWKYAETLSKELQDRSIYDTFLHARLLHTNFYEADMELDDVKKIAGDIKTVVSKLQSLARVENERQSERPK